MNNQKELLLDIFGKNMADHFDLVTNFSEEERPGILSILYTQISGWISFFRGDDAPLYGEEDIREVLSELLQEPDTLKGFLEEIRDTFDEAEENDRVVADFVKKYARECDGDRLRGSLEIIMGYNVWDGESFLEKD
jgi:hypothetical protein